MGTYRKHLSGKMAYKTFVPQMLSEIKIAHTPELDKLTEEVENAMSELNNRIALSSNEKIQNLIRQEAEYSCRMAHGEQPMYFGFMSVGPENEWLKEDSENLLNATLYGCSAMDELPISSRLLKQCHYLMCKSEKYEKKYPGEFRTSPVWIGRNGSNLQNAVFVPPAYEDMIEAISDIERYIHDDEAENIFIRAALIHYQFEMVHPFIDANGRTGRLLNSLFLIDNNVLSQPVLQLSKRLSQSCARYYMEIQHVNETGIYEKWIHFFLTMLKESAKASI